MNPPSREQSVHPSQIADLEQSDKPEVPLAPAYQISRDFAQSITVTHTRQKPSRPGCLSARQRHAWGVWDYGDGGSGNGGCGGLEGDLHRLKEG